MNRFSNSSVDQVFDLGASEAWCHLSKQLGYYAVVHCDLVKVQLEDVLSAIDVWVRYMDLFVEATRSHSCWIKASFVVSGSNNHYIFVFIKTIHLCQDLVESRPA